MNNLGKDICRVKIDQLMIRGGIVSEDGPSLSLGTPSTQEKGVYVMLNIRGEEKLMALAECINNLLEANHNNINKGGGKIETS